MYAPEQCSVFTSFIHPIFERGEQEGE